VPWSIAIRPKPHFDARSPSDMTVIRTTMSILEDDRSLESLHQGPGGETKGFLDPRRPSCFAWHFTSALHGSGIPDSFHWCCYAWHCILTQLCWLRLAIPPPLPFPAGLSLARLKCYKYLFFLLLYLPKQPLPQQISPAHATVSITSRYSESPTLYAHFASIPLSSA
jgi:hypothetical protein